LLSDFVAKVMELGQLLSAAFEILENGAGKTRFLKMRHFSEF
jgi:hypothetical protein